MGSRWSGKSSSSELESIYEDPPPSVGSLEEALNNTLIALDALPEGTESSALTCGFRRVEGEDPILLHNEEGALLQLNGVILTLDADGPETFAAPGITMTLRDVDEADWRGGAELIFALDEGLTVGYRGFHDCDI